MPPEKGEAMSFFVLPPEINSALIHAGAGSQPMLAAAAAWDGLAGELASAAASFQSVTSGLVGEAWQGAASIAMLSAAAPYAGWLARAASEATQAATQAGTLAAEFEAVRSAMVLPELVSANRNQFVSLVISNLFGQNAPAIAAMEGLYEEMWALDVSAMSAYHSGASAVAAALAPFAQPQDFLALLQNQVETNINLGLVNSGYGSVGTANVGNVNIGSANIGNYNVGAGNIGNNTLGFGNLGNGNVGFGNVGLGNFGFANIGAGLTRLKQATLSQWRPKAACLVYARCPSFRAG